MSFIQNNNKFSLVDVNASYDKLPVGVYVLKYNEREGYYLNLKKDFVLPKKIYGDQSIIDRWLKSAEVNTSKNLGVLLTGVKGSGKTITAQKFCIDANLPVVIISEEFSGTDFVDFISNSKLGRCIIFIDEFEKVYPNNERQFDLLSLMDGSFETSLIFLLTVNKYKLNDYLVNRLNRIKYVKQYNDLEPELINEVIDDMLINKQHTQSVHAFFEKVNMRTFDILVNLIKEMNLFNQDAIECGKHLNLRSEAETYNVFEIIGTHEHPCWTVEMSPVSDSVSFERKNVEYLTGEKSWEVELVIDECTVEKLSDKTKIFTHPTLGKFRFTKSNWGGYNLLF